MPSRKKLSTTTLFFINLLLVVILLVSITGCSTNSGKPSETDSNIKSSQSNTAKEEYQSADINLDFYFVKFTQSQAYLIREKHTIPYTKQVTKAVVEELIKNKKSILPSGTKVLDIKTEQGLATINFSKEVLSNYNVGSDGEALGIQSIVNTLAELPNIEKVAFQVEGKTDEPVKDWWGHVGLYDQPFIKDLSMVYEPSIWVTHPSPHQIAGVPLLVKGSALVFEGTVNAKLLDNTGKVLAEGLATADAGAPDRGDFEMSLKYTTPDTRAGTLEVFWISPEDGSIKDKISVPVQWPE